MNSLDRIEKKIRAIFETSATVQPWSDQNDLMVHQLCETIHDLLTMNSAGIFLVTPVFEITLNPLAITNWQLQPDWEKVLEKVLIDTSAEFGLRYQVAPKFALVADAGLAPGQVRITLQELSRLPRGETGVIALNSAANPPGDHSATKVPVLLLHGDKTVELKRSVINIGRKNSNQIVINDLRVSRVHAQIRRVNNEYVIFDVGSSGGTFINSERVDQHTLRPGDVISLAGFTMIFTIEQSPTGATRKEITSEIKIATDTEDQ